MMSSSGLANHAGDRMIQWQHVLNSDDKGALHFASQTLYRLPHRGRGLGWWQPGGAYLNSVAATKRFLTFPT